MYGWQVVYDIVRNYSCWEYMQLFFCAKYKMEDEL